jgi:hypothetical protein
MNDTSNYKDLTTPALCGGLFRKHASFVRHADVLTDFEYRWGVGRRALSHERGNTGFIRWGNVCWSNLCKAMGGGVVQTNDPIENINVSN